MRQKPLAAVPALLLALTASPSHTQATLHLRWELMSDAIAGQS